jgi:hypothetical protein
MEVDKKDIVVFNEYIVVCNEYYIISGFTNLSLFLHLQL